MVRIFIFLIMFVSLSGCNSDESSKSNLSNEQAVAVLGIQDTTTIFIKKISLGVSDSSKIKSISFEIDSKQGATAAPVKAIYKIPYLEFNGFLDLTSGVISVPVFGLYSNFNNQIKLTVTYIDDSHKFIYYSIFTSPFEDENGVYDNVVKFLQPSGSKKSGFDFFYMKSHYGFPVIFDVDGEIRWQLSGGTRSQSSYFENGGFFIGSPTSPAQLYRISLDGTVTSPGEILSTEATNFHHDLSKGKVGYFAEVDVKDEQINIIESILLEIDSAGSVIKKWDMGDLFNKIISSAGEDPSNFVRDGIDWFHMNSAIYSEHDDSIIISSRENFVIKIDYETGELKWILGDPTKHWYQDYPSLRSYAITLISGRYPIGQHGLSVLSDGRLMLFNNGRESFNHPAGTSAGEARDYSPVSVYSINEQNLTATESFSIDNNREIFSDICSSVYQDESGDFLVSYAAANNRTKAKIVGFNSAGERLFDYEMPTLWCYTSWNANFIDMSNLIFE